MVDERESRLQHLYAIQEKGIHPYPNRVERTHTIAEILQHFDEWQGPDRSFTLTGRIRLIRDMGKSSFFTIEDGTAKIQLYFRINDLGEEAYRTLKLLDIGDFIQVSGFLFTTHKGERTLHVREYTILAKSLRPLPEKYHGLEDVEIRQRKRYLDLLANDAVRQIFMTRSRVISAMRRYLDKHGFIEVETPILQPLYGGATARPFVTHHQTLDRDLFLRIAVELYLKRLIVGGFEKVYEIGRDFRNEGIDRSHNPEFTMMECYQAYADYNDIMRLVEEMFHFIALEVKGTPCITYQGTEIDLTPPWPRIRLLDAIAEFTGIDVERFPDKESLAGEMRANGYEADPHVGRGRLIDALLKSIMSRKDIPQLKQALFLTDYPIDISPLAKHHPASAGLTERFQPFVGGLEMGNAFTELNDPLDQRARFEDQMRQRDQGDAEAQVLDEDFIEALEVGMPPTGGLGIGVDRLTMLMTDQASIRDVILFPTMRKTAEEQ
jgi:lysyl-tRNA synthetase class 2